MNVKFAIKKIFRLVGLEIRLYNFLNAEEPLLKKIIKDFNIHTVIDVGANKGQYAESLIENNYQGTIFSFEPISEPYHILQKRAKGNDKWLAFHSAIGSKDENLTINVSENIVSSSIFNIGESSLKAEPSTRMLRKERINVTSIDNFFVGERTLSPNVMLKLDVQGYELEALKGAIGNLMKIKIIQVELSFAEVYKDAPLFMEILLFLNDHGYELFTLLPGFKDPHSGKLLQADGIFISQRI